MDEIMVTPKNRKENRQVHAKVRQKARENRSNADQLISLIQRGHSHCKEARKLLALLGDMDPRITTYLQKHPHKLNTFDTEEVK